MSCEKCKELFDTPILLGLLEEWFKWNTRKVMKVYHSKGHKIFDE